MLGRRRYHEPQSFSLRGEARLESLLPGWLNLARTGPCPASWQTGPAVDGTTFIDYSLGIL